MKKVDDVIKQAMGEGYPPSLQIRVDQNGSLMYQKSFGSHKYLFYDVASLTKIMVTVPLIMKLVDKKNIDLKKPISYYLGFLEKKAIGQIKVWECLAHNSGLTWWRPFFKTLLRHDVAARKNVLKEILSREGLGSKTKCVYSDLDFLILGFIVEEIFGESLEPLAHRHVFQSLDLKNTFYRPEGFGHAEKPRPLRSFAPTEKTSLRGLIQGAVHDENAWALGGVSAHAGVFSNLSDVADFGASLLDSYYNDGGPLAMKETLRLFTARAVVKSRGDWALGFMIPSKPLSSAGALVSPLAFGHTGFTGTSLWVDPKRRAVVTILSNRTYPSRADERLVILRRQIHDAVWESLDAKK